MTVFIMFNRLIAPNGEISSVCVCCQQTVASVRNFLDVVPFEIAHICIAIQIDPRQSLEVQLGR